MSKRTLIAGFLVLMFVLHQDFWLKGDPALVLGFLPISLAYHVGWTLLVALGWFLVARFCWPDHLDVEPPGRTGGDDGAREKRPPR